MIGEAVPFEDVAALIEEEFVFKLLHGTSSISSSHFLTVVNTEFTAEPLSPARLGCPSKSLGIIILLFGEDGFFGRMRVLGNEFDCSFEGIR